MANECITCGSKDVIPNNVRYFCIPGMVIVPNSYLLCEVHKNLSYLFEDIYEENGTRKKIDHEMVKKRFKGIGEIVTIVVPPKFIVRRWISVKDKLPENMQLVLVINKFGEMAVCRSDISSCDYIFMLNDTSHQIKYVTHWQDLPEPPK